MDLTTENNWWQRNWKWLAPTAGGIILLCVICPVLFFTLFEELRSSEVYQMALKEAKSNPDVVQVLGEPVEPGWWLNGSIEVNGPTGQADLAIPISGPKDSGTLYVIAQKTAGQWQFVTLKVVVDSQNERINLLKDSVIALPPTPTFPTPLPTIALLDEPILLTPLPTIALRDTPTPPTLLPTPTSSPIPSSSSFSGVYQQALKAASANTEVVRALGEPIEGGGFHGMVNTTGALGEADIAISISGSQNSGTLYAVASKKRGRDKWNFTLLEVLVDGQGEPIDLLAGGPIPNESQQAADSHYERGNNYFNSGHYEQAMTEYSKAVELDPEFAAAYNSLCWTGGLSGQARQVMEACERGVELAPDSGAFRDSRGLVRALTGDYAGAIEDFRFFVTWAKSAGYDTMAAKREAWIAALKAQRNPFDEATLEELQNE